MACERFLLETEDGEIDIPVTDLISLEVELDDELASMFRLRLALTRQRDGDWKYLDEDRFRIWKRLTLSGGFDDDLEELMVGYITHVKPDFPSNLSQCTLEIWGMDGSVLMDREEKLKAWPNELDSAIAAQIFSLNGFSSVVHETSVQHDEKVSTIIQRETDMQFLKRLALRNGFECYLDGATGYFGPPQLSGAPQPVLAVHFGKKETNVSRFSIEVNALTPANVSMFQVDRFEKRVLQAEAKSSQRQPLGSVAGFPPDGIKPGQVFVSTSATTGHPEMATLCQGLFHESEWFVTAEGEIVSIRYGHVLKPRRKVLIKGVGETYSGEYYVSHVTHTFTPEGYTQVFRAKRNALMTTGRENFTRMAAPGVLAG